MKISMLKAADDAAITSAPRLFIADWMMMFAIENILPWIPAGSPILSILKSSRVSILSSEIVILKSSSRFVSRTNRIALLRALEITVARATPATDMLNTRTNSRFSPTLTTPDRTRHTRGVFVSPLLL